MSTRTLVRSHSFAQCATLGFASAVNLAPTGKFARRSNLQTQTWRVTPNQGSTSLTSSLGRHSSTRTRQCQSKACSWGVRSRKVRTPTAPPSWVNKTCPVCGPRCSCDSSTLTITSDPCCNLPAATSKVSTVQISSDSRTSNNTLSPRRQGTLPHLPVCLPLSRATWVRV